MSWKILNFVGKRNSEGVVEIDPDRLKHSYTKGHICHPYLVKAVLQDLQDKYPGPISIPQSIETSEDICLDLGGMICTRDKRVVVKLSCNRTVEFWPHHVYDVVSDLERRVKEPANPKYWRGKPNRRWTKFHGGYFCYCLTLGDVKKILQELKKQEDSAPTRSDFYKKVREDIGETPHVLLPGEPGHPIQNPPSKERN